MLQKQSSPYPPFREMCLSKGLGVRFWILSGYNFRHIWNKKRSEPIKGKCSTLFIKLF